MLTVFSEVTIVSTAPPLRNNTFLILFPGSVESGGTNGI